MLWEKGRIPTQVCSGVKLCHNRYRQDQKETTEMKAAWLAMIIINYFSLKKNKINTLLQFIIIRRKNSGRKLRSEQTSGQFSAVLFSVLMLLLMNLINRPMSNLARLFQVIQFFVNFKSLSNANHFTSK